MHAFRGLPRRELITRSIVEERLAHAFSLALGEVVRDLEDALTAAEFQILEAAVTKRNFVAHHFWFERVHLMYTPEGMRSLIDELEECAEVFGRANDDAAKKCSSALDALDLTEDKLRNCMERILSGETEGPLLGRGELRDLRKKLGREQRLTHVWEAILPDGTKPLVFELADGTLWQLSDMGLGPTRFQAVDANWVEHPAIQPHLPANIIPRPKNAKPWEFEFLLRNGAVFWVRPDTPGGTHRWGVRGAKTRTEP